MDTLRKIFFKDEGHNASEKALDETEDVVDGWTNFPDGLENITMEDHLPLDAAFGRKEGASVEG